MASGEYIERSELKKAIQAFNESRLDDLVNLVHPNFVCHWL
jgi:hypothetical protein